MVCVALLGMYESQGRLKTAVYGFRVTTGEGGFE